MVIFYVIKRLQVNKIYNFKTVNNHLQKINYFLLKKDNNEYDFVFTILKLVLIVVSVFSCLSIACLMIFVFYKTTKVAVKKREKKESKEIGFVKEIGNNEFKIDSN